jgi:hypothetical protein
MFKAGLSSEIRFVSARRRGDPGFIAPSGASLHAASRSEYSE